MTETVTVLREDLATLMSITAAGQWNRVDHPEIAEAWHRLTEAKDADLEAREAAQDAPLPPGRWGCVEGEFLEIAFMGHIELVGLVTEITLGGEPGYHIDLPEKLWGGNALAWEEYSAKALYSRRPVTEASVRAAWDATVARAAERQRREEEWQRAQETRALPAAGEDSWDWSGDADPADTFAAQIKPDESL